MDSQEHSQLRQFGRLLLPSAAEVQAYLIISLIVLSIGTLTAVGKMLGIDSELAGTQSTVDQIFHSFLAAIDEQEFTPTLVVMAFWGGVGSIVYILLWFVLNILISLSNDAAVAAFFIKPSYYPSSKGFLDVMERAMLRATAGIAIIGFTVVMVIMLAPTGALLFRSAIHDWRDIQRLLGALVALAGLGLSLHVYVVLFRLLLLRIRVFGSSE